LAFSKGSRPLYLVILMVFAVILVSALSAEDPDVKKLNSQEFQQAVEERAFALDPEEDRPATRDENQRAASPRRLPQPTGSSPSGAGVPELKPGPLTVYDESQKVMGLLKPEGGGELQKFEYSYPEGYDIAAVLNEADIPFTTNPQNTGFWTSALVTMAPMFLVLLFFLVFMTRSMQGGGNQMTNFGKSRARRMTKDQPKVTFSDVAGADEAVQELTEIKEFLEAPQKFQKIVPVYRRAPCSPALRAPARRFWRVPWRARPGFRSTPSPALTLWRCTSAWELLALGTSSSRPNRILPPLYL